MAEKLKIHTNDGSYTSFVSYPTSRQGPGILVLPEIYNSNEHICDVADGLADQGFIALAPDVFWRIEPNRYLPYTEAGLKEGRTLNQQLDVDQLINDLKYGLDFLRANRETSGVVGSIGFCLGGKLSYLCAARLGVNAAVSYYGVKIDDYLDEAENITCPMILHFAGNDPRVPEKARDKIAKKFAGSKIVDIHVYPEALHGFNRVGYPPYHEGSAELALKRTLHLFHRYLVP